VKTVLITGAYRGLGYEVARKLSERSWQVLAADAPQEKTGLFWRDKELIPW
jgi:NAD(P)-dependent dehydrogenase (short-subunit alcohol dehydrogenase family)